MLSEQLTKQDTQVIVIIFIVKILVMVFILSDLLCDVQRSNGDNHLHQRISLTIKNITLIFA